MPSFQYEIRNAAGVGSTGMLAAESPLAAADKLRKDGNTIISINEHNPAGEYQPRPKRIKRDDVIFFANELAVMVDTGVPLSDALDSIAQETEHTGLKEVIRDVSNRVKGGAEFSAALEAHPKVFNRLFVSMVRASEATGSMGAMLMRVSHYMKDERDIRKQIKGAMVYPLCMLVFSILVVVGLLIFVLPRFEKIYAGKGAALPAPTRALLGISNGLVSNWPFVLLAAVAIGVGLYVYLRSESGRRLLDRVRIDTPLIGGMYRKSYLARSLRTMATMVNSGVSMLEGLEITGMVAGNLFYRRVWLDLGERVKEGSGLAEPLRECDLIPGTVAQMVSAGERTGRLGDVMNRVAEFCEDDLRSAVRAISSIIEPIMIIIMGGLIGSIALALLLPIFNVSKIMTK
ncbi:MAG: type II secretion system F family protein [Phycisphaerae bacterium]|nr:type II secretion system F family protein [Phycisphaerae bacterium]